MIVYKVVSKDNGGRRSAIQRVDSTVLHYTKGETTIPEFGKVFAFSDFESADRWARHCHEIWECEAPDAVLAPSMVAVDGQEHQKETFVLWWELFEAGASPTVSTMHAPSGTVLCSEIKLTRLSRKEKRWER